MSSQSMIARLVLALIFSVFCTSVQAAPCQGKVIYAASDAIYLDQGLSSGLAPGQTILLTRGAKSIANVQIVFAAERSARAQLVNAIGAFKPESGDEFECPQAAEKAPLDSSNTDSTILKNAPALPDDAVLTDLWTKSISTEEPYLIAYKGEKGNATVPKVMGSASTYYQGRGYFGTSTFTSHEQRILLWLDADNLFLPGLGLVLRGNLGIRYDSVNDGYLTDRRAIPAISTVAVRYRSKKGLIEASAGRIFPNIPLAGIVDGADITLHAHPIYIRAFGGFRPSMIDLAPRADYQSFGAGIGVEPRLGDARLQTDVSFLGETHSGSLDRTALNLGARVFHGSLYSVNAAATLDILKASSNTREKNGLNLTDASLYFSTKPSTFLIDGSVRFHDRILFYSETEDVKKSWIDDIGRSSFGRAELGVDLFSGQLWSIRPFAFCHSDFQGSNIDRGFAGAGLTYRTISLFGTRAYFDATLDYGYGTEHLGNLDLSLTTPAGLLDLTSGLYNVWMSTSITFKNSLAHVLYLKLSKDLANVLKIWLSVEAAYDHAIVRLEHPQGVWMQGAAGATADF